MTGKRHYRYYLEYATPTEKRRASIRRGELGNHTGNVVALVVPDLSNYAAETLSLARRQPEGFGAVFGSPNSPVQYTGLSYDYLAACCIRISEAQAREIHPALFRRLDDRNMEEQHPPTGDEAQ